MLLGNKYNLLISSNVLMDGYNYIFFLPLHTKCAFSHFCILRMAS